jgi:hypothetical protein
VSLLVCVGVNITPWLLSAPITAVALVSDARVDAPDSASVTAADAQITAPLMQPTVRPAPAVVEGTRERFEQARALIQGLTVNEAIARLAESFLGSPYLAGSLDGAGPEQLRLDLTRFDCMLFIEQLLALALSDSFDQFVEHTRNLRYRDGRVTYCTRQHYFHDWVRSAQSQNLLETTSGWPGETTRSLPLNFMSQQRQLYRPMQSEELFDCIRRREESRQVVQHYVPLHAIESVLPRVQSGDLFAIATRVEGLDVSHTGVLVREGGSVNAIHAAPGRGVMRSRSFARYLRSIPDAIGAVIVRPVHPERMSQEQPGT